MKNINKVKAIYRIAWIIALVAVIGFTMAACGGGDGGGNGGGGHTHDWNLETGLCSGCSDLYYSIGDTGPGGGKIFHVDPSGFFVEGYTGAEGTFAGYTAHYLEVAPADAHTTTVAWKGSASGYVLITTGTGITTFTTGQNDTTFLTALIGKGRRDTQIIVAFYEDTTQSSNATVVTDTAANRAADYATASGHTDWFLPSLGELNVLYQSTSAISGMPTTGYFWSSSQRDYQYAWSQNFNASGTRSANFKDFTSSNVRAIRAF